MEQNRLTLAMLWLLGSTSAAVMERPSYVTKCPLHSSEFNACTIKQAPEVLKVLRNGDKSFGLFALDPLKLDSLRVEQSSISINLTKVVIEGLGDTTITNITHNEPSKEFRIDFVLPKLVTNARCKLDANFGSFHVKGDGKIRVVTLNATGHWKVKYSHVKHDDGLEYMQLSNPEWKMQPRKAEFLLEDMFKGDAALGATMNGVINNNWEIIMEAVLPPLESSFSEIVRGALATFVEKIPVDKLFA